MNELQSDGQEFNAKVILEIALRYKFLIISTVVIMTLLASVYAYLKPNIYRSSTNIKLTVEKGGAKNFSSVAFIGGVENFDNEIAVIKSSTMIKKTLSKLDLGTRYYFKNKYKLHELYKQSPFVVKVLSMENMMLGKAIYIQPIDNEHYRLRLKDTPFSLGKLKKMIFSSLPPALLFSQEYKYGETVTTKWFKVQVQRLSNMNRAEYFFTYMPNESMGWLVSSGLSVHLKSKRGSILNISYQDVVPLRAKEIVNAVTQTYFEDEISEKLKITDKTLAYLDKQLAVLTKVLNKSASKLKSFKQSNTDIILDKAVDNTASKITEIESRLREMDFEESVLGNLKAYIEDGKDLTTVTISESDFKDTSLIEKIQRYQELSDNYRKKLTVYTEFHPEVIKAADDINIMKLNIKYIVDNDLAKMAKRKQFLIGEMAELKSSLVGLPQKERTLASLTRNFTVNEKIYSFLLEKRTEMQILYSSTTPNVRILDEASVPGAPLKPNRKFMIIVGMVLGLIIGFVLAFLLYLRNDTVKSNEEVEGLTDLPLLGLIPYHQQGKYTLAYEEAFRTLRTNLEFIKIDKPSKIILVASAISGEGKSTTIKHLAEMLIKLNRKVIVLDFDLRRPSVHKYFKGLNNERGLSMLLSGQCSINECLQKTQEGINVIPAGPIPPNPSELIMSEACELLFKTLRGSFDYILIDSPPYSVVTDATLLMKKADITLFSTMVEHTKREHVKQIKSIVQQYDIVSPGLVFNGVKLKKKERHGYGYFENT